MTLTATLTQDVSTADVRAYLANFYAGKPFIDIVDGTPRIKDVAASNYAHLGAAVEGRTVAIFVAIDNLLKGAAGGCVQWMNLLLGLDETAGLTTPGPGWI